MLVLIVMCAFAACYTSNELLDYKIAAKTTIETYAEGKGQVNYNVENWASINELVMGGKTAIDVAMDKIMVDSAVAETKQSIDEVLRKEEEMEKELKRRLKNMDDISGIIFDSCVDNPIFHGIEDWFNQIEVSLEFPRVVKQGEEFEVKVITTNVSDYDVNYNSSYSRQNKGVLISIISQGNDEFNYALYWQGYSGIVDQGLAKTTIHAGKSIEYIWKFDGSTIQQENSAGIVAPKGIYDIYLTNGDVYYNSIEIV